MNKFREMKVFNTSQIPHELQRYLYESEIAHASGYVDYRVGSIFTQLMRDGCDEAATTLKEIDDWFLQNGAEPEELIIIGG